MKTMLGEVSYKRIYGLSEHKQQNVDNDEVCMTSPIGVFLEKGKCKIKMIWQIGNNR